MKYTKQKYTKEWIREYNKTWYWMYIPYLYKFPENLVCATPVRLFGFFIGWKCKLAKKNYQWNKKSEKFIKSYRNEKLIAEMSKKEIDQLYEIQKP